MLRMLRPNAGAVAEDPIIGHPIVKNPGGRIYIQCHHSTVNFSINTIYCKTCMCVYVLSLYIYSKVKANVRRGLYLGGGG